MNATIRFLFAALFLAAAVCRADVRPQKGTAAQTKTVVVGNIENKSRLPADSVETLRTRVVGELKNTHKFEMAERKAMGAREREMDMVDMGLSDGRNAPRDGNIHSAGYEVSGTILSVHFVFPETARMEFQLEIIDLNTQLELVNRTIVARFQRDEEMDSKAQMLDALLALAAKQAAWAVVEYAFPPKILTVGENDVAVNIPSTQVEIGDLFDVYSLGEEMFDPDSGESLGSDEEKVGRVRISRPGPKFSKAVPTKGTNLRSIEKGMILRRVSQDMLDSEADRREAGL